MKIGIVGMGRMGHFHLECLCITNFASNFLSYWDPFFQDPIKIGSHHITCAKDWDAFVNQPDLDTVLLCSPTENHFDQLTTLIKAGKTVFVEHPVCFTLKQIEAIDSFSDGEKSSLRMLPNQFNQTDFLYALEAVNSNLFGTIQNAELSSSGTQLIDVNNQSILLFEMMALYLDQFLQITPTLPSHIFAASRDSGFKEFPTHHLSLTLFSEKRRLGRIQIDRDCIMPSKASWKIDGTHGGYLEERIYTLTDEQEIYSQPVSKIFQNIPEEKSSMIFIRNPDQRSAELQRAISVVQILNCIELSLKENRVVSIF